MARGEWIDHVRAKIRLEGYASKWIDERAGLRPRTVQLYRWTLRKHIAPYLGGVPLGKLDTPMIREWRAKLLREGVSAGMVAKAYRLLRAVLMTAVNEDQLLLRNPCRVPGADKESPDERPVLSVAQVVQLADAVPRRYRVMILVAALASLRFGEVTALQRNDADLKNAVIHVRRQFLEVTGQGLVCGPPKSRAGIRDISIPRWLVSELEAHMDAYVGSSRSALLFTTAGGVAVRRASFQKLFNWTKVVADLGFEGLHFHDLRHTGNTLAAGSKVSTRDLMARMGHDSMEAALLYQHKSREADLAIAAHLDGQLSETVKSDADHHSDDGGDDGSAGV